jgi:UDPglucose 6-dehydrogenase
MKIAVIGTGYVGLVSGACFSEFGFDVTCVDNDPDKIIRIGKGEMPIYEPGLADLVGRNAAAGRLHFTTDLTTAVAAADAVFIAVGTPTRRGDGHADLSFVYAVAREAGALPEWLYGCHHQIHGASWYLPGSGKNYRIYKPECGI